MGARPMAGEPGGLDAPLDGCPEYGSSASMPRRRPWRGRAAFSPNLREVRGIRGGVDRSDGGPSGARSIEEHRRGRGSEAPARRLRPSRQATTSSEGTVQKGKPATVDSGSRSASRSSAPREAMWSHPRGHRAGFRRRPPATSSGSGWGFPAYVAPLRRTRPVRVGGSRGTADPPPTPQLAFGGPEVRGE